MLPRADKEDGDDDADTDADGDAETDACGDWGTVLIMVLCCRR